ncbi:MAG: hypothetical protein PVJ57_19090 [Phycisphaerae bacterium]|jgi:hypothetical protein
MSSGEFMLVGVDERGAPIFSEVGGDTDRLVRVGDVVSLSHRRREPSLAAATSADRLQLSRLADRVYGGDEDEAVPATVRDAKRRAKTYAAQQDAARRARNG